LGGRNTMRPLWEVRGGRREARSKMRDRREATKVFPASNFPPLTSQRALSYRGDPLEAEKRRRAAALQNCAQSFSDDPILAP